MPGGGRRRRGERGFALLIVLGAMPMLAMLGTEVQLSGRTEVALAENERAAAVDLAAADGAIREAVFRLVAGTWGADGTTRMLRVGGRSVAIRIVDEAGLINPNVAPRPLLQALLLTVGVEPIEAQTLADCIFDYRSPGDAPSPHGAKMPAYRAAGKTYGPSGVPFQRLDELRLVLGMTDDIYRRVLPYLSLYTGQGIDLIHADPVVRTAYRLAGPNGGYLRPMPLGNVLVARIVARVAGGGGVSPARQATVRVFDDEMTDASYEIADWTSQRD
jgi:general secretion pathway protein K